jgi:pimeloyl-ACP methyl ester carboxylesterase
MTTLRITGPAGVLKVDDGGQGELPVVLAHSLAGNAAQWAHQLEHLRKTRRAVAFDFRGHGASDPPGDHDYTLAGLAGDIAAVVDALSLPRFVLAGHSMGGGVALVYAGTHPDQVAGLFLLDPIGDGKQIPAREAAAFVEQLDANYEPAIQGYWTQIAGPDPVVRERLLADLRATPRETVSQVLRNVMRFDPDPALAGYPGPILSVVTPQNDQSFSLHRLDNGFPHRTVTGTGHWIQLDQPDEMNRILDEFLESVMGKEKRRSESQRSR